MTERPEVIDVTSIIRILPHKPPATLVDRVIEVEPGERILTGKNITISEPSIAGHFPGMPMLPSGVLIEIMVQSCCLLAYATEQYNPANKIVTLIAINKAKFRRSLCPGDGIEVEANLIRKRSNVWRFKVNVYEDDHGVADCELALSIHDREDTL
ncbi:MAG: 3-hydroxyacyl-ACP dehydratase FabZ [Deltaproteobacteria bacterium]|nr:3-hydroxyacyl-ACP dehydratase FabZ [Deltaproteobacteria bacterium]